MLTSDQPANSLSLNGDIYESDLTYMNELISRLDESKPIRVFLNSLGGDLATGISMFNRFRSIPGLETINTGICASAASLAFLGGTVRTMGVGSLIMNHRASVFTGGNVEDLTNTAETLTKLDEQICSIIMSATKLEKEKVEEMMSDETYFDGEEAVTLGLATRRDDSLQAVALGDLTKARNKTGLDLKMGVTKPQETPAPAVDDKPVNSDATPAVAVTGGAAPEDLWAIVRELKSRVDCFTNSAAKPDDKTIEDLKKQIGDGKLVIENLTKRLDELEKGKEAPKNLSDLAAPPFTVVPPKAANKGWRDQIAKETDPAKRLEIITTNWR